MGYEPDRWPAGGELRGGTRPLPKP